MDGSVAYYFEGREGMLLERYGEADWGWVRDEPDEDGWFDSEAKALEAAQDYVAARNNAIKSDHGDIGAVTYFTADVLRMVYEAGRGKYAFPDDYEVEHLSTLSGSPEEAAFYDALRSKRASLETAEGHVLSVSEAFELAESSRGCGASLRGAGSTSRADDEAR